MSSSSILKLFCPKASKSINSLGCSAVVPLWDKLSLAKMKSFFANSSAMRLKCPQSLKPLKPWIKTITLFGKIPIKINDIEYNIEYVLNKLLEKTHNNNKIIRYKNKIPDEFLDPILLVEINDPIELPETKNILNKETIFNHLIFYQTNPFSGSNLNKENLLEYNNLPEVKERCKNLVQKINEWKQKNKM